MKTKDTKKILIVNPFGIGDVLFSTPLVSALRVKYSSAHIGYLCNRRTESILAANPNINEIFVYEKDELKQLWSQSKLKGLRAFMRLLGRVKSRKFNILVDLSLGRQYSLMAFLIGIRERVGFNYKNRGRFLTQKIDIEGYGSKHIVDYYLSFLEFLGIEPPQAPRLQFDIKTSDEKWADNFLRSHNMDKNNVIIGVVPGGGTSWGEKAAYKHWSEDKFTKLIDRLTGELSVKIILFGSAQEADKCRRIIQNSRYSPVSACGVAHLSEFAALTRHCDLIIANDGGPLHVAVSQRVPTVSLFGPVDDAVYGPYPANEDNTVIKEALDCRPCYKKFKIPECSNRICLEKIEVDKVFNAAGRIIRRRSSVGREAHVAGEKTPLSVVVLTKNEESNIGDCLKSVEWADEIIIVDDFSTDKTSQIASGYTDKVYKRKMDNEGIHRNWAYSRARNKWVLSLDADELVTPELKKEIERLLNGKVDFSAFSVPLRNYIGNHWVRYGGWYPAGKVRLFKKNEFKYEEVGVHPRVFIDGKCGHLKGDIIHKGYPDFAHFLDSLNRQTTLEAQKWVADGRIMSLGRALRKAHDRFFKTFILKRGYRDGFVGFMVAFFASLYQIMSYAKYWELRKDTQGLRNKQ